ncbi:uncharacterized protein O3C94_016855 [Discoglossus pictus]
MMSQDKEMSAMILNHILETLSLLTGKISVLQHLIVIDVNQDKKMTERILTHTLKIIYLLTGEEYTIVKKKSPHSHHLTGEGDKDGHTWTLGISANMSSGHVKPSVVSKFDQEAKPDVRSHQQVKEEEIPVNISEGPHDGNIDTIFVVKVEEDERDDQDIQQVEIYPNSAAGPTDENLDTVSVIKEKEDERDKKDILPVTIHSDTRADVSKTMDMCEEHHISLLPPDCTREDFSILRDYMNANQSCVKKQTGEKILGCSDGGKRFTKHSNPVKPKQVHTGKKTYGFADYKKYSSTTTNLNIRRSTETGPFVCSKCGKCYSWKSALFRHKRLNTCMECGKCFNWPSTLKDHKRTHKGKKPFSCSECGKCFNKSSNLKDHKKTHNLHV